MTFCNCYCCQGNGCTRQYIGYFNSDIYNCLSTTCSKIFSKKCLKDTNVGGSILAEFINFSYNFMIVFYFILGLFLGFCVVLMIYDCIIDYKRKNSYVQQETYTPQEILSQSPPPYDFIERHQIHIDTHTVTNSTQNHSYIYFDNGCDVSQTDTDNF